MSTASALLSMIAPAAPTTSQGSATVDASAFEGLLASMLGGGADEGLAEVAPAPEQPDLTASTPAAPLPSPPQPLLQINAAALSVVASEPAVEVVDGDMAVTAPTPVATEDTLPAAEPVSAEPVIEAPAADAAATDAAVIAVPLPAPAMPTPVVDASAAAEAAPASAPAPIPASIPAQAAAQPIAVEAPAIADPVADPVAPLAPAAPTPKAEASPATTPLPVEKTPATKTAEAGPQVRPAVKADPSDAPEVLPPAPAQPDAKTATAQPLTQPPATPVVVGPTPSVVTPVRLQVGDMEQARLDDSAMVEVARPHGEAPSRTATVLSMPDVPQSAPTVVGKAAPEPLTQPAVSAPASASPPDEAAPPAETAKPSGAPDPADVAPSPVPDAERKSAETPRPVETPAPRPQGAERASRSVETNAAVDTAAPSTPVTTTPQASVATTPNPAVAPASAATKTVEAPATETAEGDAAAEVPVDATAPEATPSAQTAHAAREALGSTLSRGAIEATAQIAAQIQRKLDGRSTRFEMSLTPDELGRVDIKLDIDAEGRLAARLAFDNPAAATDLRGRVDDLRRQLEQQGFHLADDAFEFTQRDSGSGAFDRGQDSSQGQDRAQSRAFAAAARLNTEADAVAQPPRWQALSLTPAGVDMKV